MKGRTWAQNEIEHLKKFYKTKPIAEISTELCRPQESVKKKHEQLVCLKKRWNEEAIAYLKENYGKIPAKEIANKIGTTPEGIRIKAHRMGLRSFRTMRINFSREQITWLKKNYPHISNEVCALFLNCSGDTIRRRAKELGLTKTKQFLFEVNSNAGRKRKKRKTKEGEDNAPIATSLKPLRINDNRGIHTIQRIDWQESDAEKTHTFRERNNGAIYEPRGYVFLDGFTIFGGYGYSLHQGIEERTCHCKVTF